MRPRLAALGYPTLFDDHCFQVKTTTEKPYRRKVLSTVDDRYDSERVRPGGRPESVFAFAKKLEMCARNVLQGDQNTRPGCMWSATEAVKAQGRRLALLKVIISLYRGGARERPFCKRRREFTPDLRTKPKGKVEPMLVDHV
jgi:hypothetical protein